MSKMEIFYLVLGVLVALFMALVPLFRSLAKKTETKLDDSILELSIKAVEFVEANFLNKKGASKHAIAKEIINASLEKANKEVSEKVVDKAIEKAWAMNELSKVDEKGK